MGEENADFLSNILLHALPLTAIVWMRALIERACHECDAIGIRFAFDKKVEVLHHVSPVRIVLPKISLDGGDKLVNDSCYKLFAQFIAVCRRSKWSKHVTNSPLLALLATAGSKAACKISSACSKALC